MLSYNVKLEFESTDERDRYLKTLEQQRFVFNECSKCHFGAEKNSLVDLHKKFYQTFRREHPEIPSNIVIHTIQNVLSCYRSIKANKHKIEKAPEKKKLSIRLTKNTASLKVHKKEITLTAISGKRVKAKFAPYKKLQMLIESCVICDPLIFERDGNIWLNLTFRTPASVIKEVSVCGIDLGIKNSVATSEGKVFQDKKFNADRRKLRYLKRKLQSKASKGSKSARRHLSKLIDEVNPPEPDDESKED